MSDVSSQVTIVTNVHHRLINLNFFRSFCFDPFLDVSIPIPTSNAQPMNTVLSASNSKNSLSQASVDSDTSAASGPVPVKGLWNRWSGNKEPQKCTLEDCLAAYTGKHFLPSST